MPLITDRQDAAGVMDRMTDKGICLAIFCTASHWNTEAILLAASRYARKHGIGRIPVSVAMTFQYPYMPQACRVTHSGSAKEGFLSVMKHLEVLCAPDASYPEVDVLPHLDHADPIRDRWALTQGLPMLASVMFDAQKYPREENLALTGAYVKEYGHQVLVEGIMEELNVEGRHAANASSDHYVYRAVEYVKATGVDLLVADLGTEQQSTSTGRCIYNGSRARELTDHLKKPMLVLHGTSCLTGAQMATLAVDGVARVNMWTRIAREAGQYAAHRLVARAAEIELGNFEAAESRQYLYDSIEKAAEIMEGVLDLLGYAKLSA